MKPYQTISNGPHRALTEFRKCFEASMTFEEALERAGFTGRPKRTIEVLNRCWNRWSEKRPL